MRAARLTVLVGLFIATLAGAQGMPPLQMQQNGVNTGSATTLNCKGNVLCTKRGTIYDVEAGAVLTATPTRTATPILTLTPSSTATRSPTPSPTATGYVMGPQGCTGSDKVTGADAAGNLLCSTDLQGSGGATATAVTPTPTPVVLACPTKDDGSGGVQSVSDLNGFNVAVGCLPTSTSTVASTATVTATPIPTATSTAFVCGAGFVLDRAHPEACVELPTPVAYPTPTVVLTVTATPVVCRTATVYGAQVGGLYKANPEECVATPAPTATLGVTPTYTIPFATPTVNLSATPTAVVCATNAAYGYGGLYGAQPELCQGIAATVTPVATVTPTAVACVTNAAYGYGGLYGAQPELCQAIAATATAVPTVTNTASPMPISTVSPGLAGARLGTSDTMARADHVHAMPDSSVAAGSYTNANITVNSKGLLTAASSGTNIPAGFALYVDKKGTDSASCGPLNAPCLTIEGAQAIIRTNNDNGFATCSLDNSKGCGRCSVATSTTCNENADCPGGETCTATTSVCSGLSLGACTGPSKSYDVHIGVGDYYETLAAVCSGGSNAGKLCSEATCATGGGTCLDHAPPSPGNILYLGNDPNLTRIISSDWATMDVTNRVGLNATSLTVMNLAATNGSAFRATGGWQLSIWNKVGFVFTGTDTTNSWGVNITGSKNYTDSFYDPLVFAFSTGGANANGVHVQTYASSVCTGDALRACDANADCVGAGSGDTCDLATPTKSADFYFQGGQIQPTGASGLSGTGVWVEGIACGNALNPVFADVDISGSNGGAGTTVGFKVSRTSCAAGSDATIAAQGNTRAIVRRVGVAGTHNPTLTDFDTSLSVDSNSKVQVFGEFDYNECTRSLGNSTSLQYMDTSEFHGGVAELGVLNCSAPPTPIDGECWYDAATDLRRECRVNGSTVGILTTDNLSQYDSQVCTSICMGGTLSSTPTTLLTLASWTNTGKNTEITAKVQIDVSAARIVTCKLKNAGTTVETSTVNMAGSVTTGTIPLHYFDNASGTQGPFTLTCETDNVTGNGVATNASLMRITSNVASLATTSSQIADSLSDETGTGALVFGTAPTLGAATLTGPTLTGDTTVTGRVLIGPTVTPVITPTSATATPTATLTPTPTATSTLATATATGATATPTPSASPTPGLLVQGVSVSGCTCYTAMGASTSPYAVRGGTTATQAFACTAPAVLTAVGKLRCFLDRDVPFGAEFNCQVEKAAQASMTATADAGAVALTWTKQSVPRCYIHGTGNGGEWRCDPGARGANYTDGWVLVKPEECYHIRADVSVLSNYTINWCECPGGAFQ